MSKTFRALVVRRIEINNFQRSVEEKSIDDLPRGEVLMRVLYSSLNYKDGLSCMGNPGVTRHYPHTPGIDAAGTVESSFSPLFKAGDQVVVVGSDLGMNIPGGFGQYIRVPAEWVTHLPKGLSLYESMIYGTAGYTAALAVTALHKHGLGSTDGEVVVTGATGGVGSMSVALLAKLGYRVVASTGKYNARKFLNRIGAHRVILRKELNESSGKLLLKEIWSGAIDTVGGNALANILKSTKECGVVMATGMVSSTNLSTTVFPFILRGVSLLGVNTQATRHSNRHEIWEKLSDKWKIQNLDDFSHECNLDTLDSEIDCIIRGEQQGRVVVNMQ